MCFKFNLEAGRQFYIEIASRKCIGLGHKHLTLGKRVAKKRVLFQTFSNNL
jgi:hypothetical protein